MFQWSRDNSRNFVTYVNTFGRKAYLKVTKDAKFYGYRFKNDSPYNRPSASIGMYQVFEGKSTTIADAIKQCEEEYYIWAGIKKKETVAPITKEEIPIEIHGTRENGFVTLTCTNTNVEIHYIISQNKKSTINSKLYVEPIKTNKRVHAVAVLDGKIVVEVEVL